MQAINHVTTALLLKRAFPKASLPILILGSEAMEILWVGLNLIGMEKTVIDSPMRSIADIHLVHMPYSHSIASSVILARLIGAFMLWRKGKAALMGSFAVMAAILSHVVLDLLVHAPDIALWPLREGKAYGTGLYAHAPMLALFMETLWGVFCWRVYRGNWQLLTVILLFSLFAIPSYSPTLNMGEDALGGQSTQFALFILLQIATASVLVWFFSKNRRVGE